MSTDPTNALLIAFKAINRAFVGSVLIGWIEEEYYFMVDIFQGVALR